MVADDKKRKPKMKIPQNILFESSIDLLLLVGPDHLLILYMEYLLTTSKHE